MTKPKLTETLAEHMARGKFVSKNRGDWLRLAEHLQRVYGEGSLPATDAFQVLKAIDTMRANSADAFYQGFPKENGPGPYFE